MALSLPLAVRSLPPRAVAPSPPTLVIRPALSRVSLFGPLGAERALGRADRLPPVDANRPLLSRLYVLAMVAAVSSP